MLVHTEKQTDSVWDVKYVRGGLMDIEFIAQYLMLRHAPARPELIQPATVDALCDLGEAGILDPSDADALSAAAAFFKNVLQATRIACAPGPLPGAMSGGFERRLPSLLGEDSLAAVEARLGSLQEQVRVAFARLTADRPVATGRGARQKKAG